MLASPAQVRLEVEHQLAEMMNDDKAWVVECSRKMAAFYGQDVSKCHMSCM